VLQVHSQPLDLDDEVVYPGVSGERLICHAGIAVPATVDRQLRMNP
jgi:hypothetical protein